MIMLKPGKAYGSTLSNFAASSFTATQLAASQLGDKANPICLTGSQQSHSDKSKAQKKRKICKYSKCNKHLFQKKIM